MPATWCPALGCPEPLDAYAGEYQHPGYGTLVITVDGDTLRPRLGTMDLSLAHRHYETFDLEWHELGDQSHLFPLMFLSDPDGDITALTVPFEPSVGPLRFDRLPDARARIQRFSAGCAVPTPWARSRSWSPRRATGC